ncbi:MAG: 2-hydroxymuconate tautomerase [Dissulfurispiraceae bacterium]
MGFLNRKRFIFKHTKKTLRGEKMPIVQIDFLEGRSIEQKRELAKRVTQAVCETAKCPPEAVTILLRELPATNIAKAGTLISDKQ